MAGCKTPTYTIGMTEAEFSLHQKMLTTLVEKTAHRAVYKRLTSDDGKGYQTYQYFYFVDGKLTRIAASEG